MADEIHIGKLIKHQVSQRPELTIRGFAERLGVHEQTVYDIYRRADIHTDQLKRIAEILELPITYFFFPDDLPDLEHHTRTETPAEPLRNGRARDADPPSRPAPSSEANGSTRQPAQPACAELRRELEWASEKIALLEARLRDKDDLIALLRQRG